MSPKKTKELSPSKDKNETKKKISSKRSPRKDENGTKKKISSKRSPGKDENGTKKKKSSKRTRADTETETNEDAEESEQTTAENSKKISVTGLGKFERYKEREWQLTLLPHHLLPSFNITKDNDIHGVRDHLETNINLPRSIFVNSKFADDVDICHRRTVNLATYMQRTKKLRTAYQTALKNKKTRKDESKGIYPNTLVNYAQRRETLPDKHFARDYDFYYTGGNLCVNMSNSQVAHVGGNNMDSLFLSVLNIEGNNIKAHHLTSVDLSKSENEENEIFDVQFSAAASDLLFTRQKYSISLRKYDYGKLNLVRNFKSNDVPLISFTTNSAHPNHLTISDLQHKVRICDIESNKPIQTWRMMAKDLIKPQTNWNMIRALNSHVYIYAACRKLNLVDMRIPESEWQNNHSGFQDGDSCSNFCSLALSNFDNLFYVGANHKAYCLDSRYMDKNINSKNAAVARWTHQMSSFPLMMAANRHQDTEYIVLQSPMNSDLRICENMQYLQETDPYNEPSKKARTELPLEYLYKSPSLPFMPPSLEILFEEARLNGKCLKQSTGMEKRVNACVCGLSFASESSSPFILTATSYGDIFARQMSAPDEIDTKLNASDVMQEYEDKIIRSVRKTPLNVTTVWDLAGMSKVFRCPLLSDNKVTEDALEPVHKRKYMGRWQKSLQHLSKYKDALASDLLSAWDFEIEDEKDFSLRDLPNTQMSESKVSNWLSTEPDIKSSTLINMTEIPADVFNATNLTFGDFSFNDTMENIKTQITMENNSTQITVENHNTQISVDQLAESPMCKPKVAKKKKAKYVKGF